jgi:AcrR family transcriptional regulator
MATPLTYQRPGKISPQESTKRIIVETALAHFSRFGIEGVSLSQLREASGQHNRSAIHYHFGNKEGLLAAVTDHVTGRLTPLIEISIAKCKVLQQNQQLTVEGLVEQIGRPFSHLFFMDSQGRDCIRFLSHLTHDLEPDKLALSLQPVRELVQEMTLLLSTLMPGKRRSEYTTLLFLSMIMLVETLTMSSRLQHESETPVLNEADPMNSEIMTMSMRFACGGLVAASQTN